MQSQPRQIFLIARDGVEESTTVASSASPASPVWGEYLTAEQFRLAMELAEVPVEWRSDFFTIASCETTGFWAWAVGDGGNSLGIMQLWRGWFRAAGFPTELWSDPVINLRVAVYVRTVRGRFGGGGGWSCADMNGIY